MIWFGSGIQDRAEPEGDFTMPERFLLSVEKELVFGAEDLHFQNEARFGVDPDLAARAASLLNRGELEKPCVPARDLLCRLGPETVAPQGQL